MSLAWSDVEFAARRLKDSEGRLSIWGESLLKAYAQVSAIPFMPPIVWTNHKTRLIFGSRIFNKLSQSGQSNAHLILSVRDPFRLTGVPTSFSYDLKSYGEIYRAVSGRGSDGLLKLQHRMLKIIDKTGASIFVANSTIDPINRLWLSVARNCGLKTICLQHGVYSKNIPDYAQEEDIVDRYIALDESQAKIVARNIDSEKIFSLGGRESFWWKPPEDGLTICFVGEDWERYGFVELKKFLVSRYREIAASLTKGREIEVCYKPHPSENQSYGIDVEMRRVSKRELMRPDVYIGFSSSLLRDVSAQGKLAIQIFDKKFNADNFFDNGYCLSVDNDVNLIASIAELISKEQEVPCVRERSLESFL